MKTYAKMIILLIIVILICAGILVSKIKTSPIVGQEYSNATKSVTQNSNVDNIAIKQQQEQQQKEQQKREEERIAAKKEQEQQKEAKKKAEEAETKRKQKEVEEAREEVYRKERERAQEQQPTPKPTQQTPKPTIQSTPKPIQQVTPIPTIAPMPTPLPLPTPIQSNTNYLNGYIKVYDSVIQGYLLKTGMYYIYELANGSVWIQPTIKEVTYMETNPKVTVYANQINNYFLVIDGSKELIPVVPVSYKKVNIIYPTKRIRPLMKLQGQSPHGSSGWYTIQRQIDEIKNNWKRAEKNQIYCLEDGTDWQQVSNQNISINNTKVIICKYNSLYFMKIESPIENGIVSVVPYEISE